MGEFNPFDPNLTNKTTPKSLETPEISNEDRVKIKQEEATAILVSLAQNYETLLDFLGIDTEEAGGESGRSLLEDEKEYIQSLKTAGAIEAYLNRIREFEARNKDREE